MLFPDAEDDASWQPTSGFDPFCVVVIVGTILYVPFLAITALLFWLPLLLGIPILALYCWRLCAYRAWAARFMAIAIIYTLIGLPNSLHFIFHDGLPLFFQLAVGAVIASNLVQAIYVLIRMKQRRFRSGL